MIHDFHYPRQVDNEQGIISTGRKGQTQRLLSNRNSRTSKLSSNFISKVIIICRWPLMVFRSNTKFSKPRFQLGERGIRFINGSCLNSRKNRIICTNSRFLKWTLPSSVLINSLSPVIWWYINSVNESL